ncbi:Uncharacterised protein [Vibrio cholerae]|nr:Uncharacterised protein [Vibrio cholerae]
MAPRPISSSGVNAIEISPWGIEESASKISIAVMISAIPALLSAPNKVVPSVVMRL